MCISNINLNQQPAWLDLPGDEQRVYWTCSGVCSKSLILKAHVPSWRGCFSTKEEAEAYASSQAVSWVRDGKDAQGVTLGTMMNEVRRRGDLGLVLKGWKDGVWVDVKRWPSSEPIE